jgi:CRP/FNR family transcriptional regulator, cyclic AMP receptor protein
MRGRGATHGARVLDELPELTGALSGEALARARLVAARVLELDPGPWAFDPGVMELEDALGLLVLDGLLMREIVVLHAIRSSELLGEGDILRPWTASADETASIAAETRWEVVVPSRIALLDRRFALSIAPWPTVMGAILDRAIARARGALFGFAVCHLPRVESRILVTLWHLADRWGRVTPAGVLLPISFTHRTLAGMVGARRPSVTTAVGRLSAEGRLERRPDGGWLLPGQPPAELADLRRATELSRPSG